MISEKEITKNEENFPIVDKNVIFMHGIAALQELISRLEGQEYRVMKSLIKQKKIKNKN